MADKEATIYIIDVGRSMGRCSGGRTETDLEWAMHYVWDKITATVATNRKTLNVGVLALKTDMTRNDLGAEEAFQHISVIHPITQILLPTLKNLQRKIKTSATDEGDSISAIVVAIQLIEGYCKKLKYIKKIVLVTNGEGEMDDDEQLEEISRKIKEDGIELTILGVDFDDPDYGVKEENKSASKARNEALLKTLSEACNGVFGTLKEAIEQMGVPRLKTVRPVFSYRGVLTLGNPENIEKTLSIDVERFPRTMVARAPGASNFIVRPGAAQGDSSVQSSATLQENHAAEDSTLLETVRNARTYEVVDETAPKGKIEVDREELARGYEYGQTAVHISKSDENVTRLETVPGLQIIGFVPQDKYERYMNMSVSCIIIAQKANDKAQMALSSLIHALYELDSYAVARIVRKAGNEPLIILMAPSIEPDYECLLDVQLPFAEDMRSYSFPPLDKLITISGKTLTEHRNLPSEGLNQAMDEYVDKMDLSTFGTDADGKAAEYMAMEETFTPILHRIDQAIRWRAVHETEPIPKPYDILTKYSHPPEQLVKQTVSSLDKLKAAAELKKVPPKVQGRRRNREQNKPLSGLNVEELLGHEKRTRISPENAIPEFKQFLATTEDPGAISDATKQLSAIILSQIKDSFGDSGYGRAIEALHVMRDELIALEEPALYNTFLGDLKAKLQANELGGDRRDMWWEIRGNGLGLIDEGQSEFSDVRQEEARAFFSLL